MTEDTNLGDGLKVTGNYHVDSLYGPYLSIADANAKVTLYLRSVSGVTGLLVGRTVAIDDGTVRKEYWWDGGTADTNLVEKVAGSGGGGSTYTGVSPSNVTVGGIPSGTNLTGKTFTEVIQLLTVTYINPSFTGFNFTGQAQTVEIGTILTGSRTMTWSINSGSGTIPTIDILDNTAGTTLLAGTPNDGTQTLTINTIQLNTGGATQSWRLRGNNTSPVGTFNSGDFNVVGRFILFFGATTSTPTTSAQIRALPQTQFYTGGGVIQLNTGTGIKFGVAVPPGSTVVSAIDLDASNANVTYTFVGNISVTDAGGTARLYPYYEANIAVAYSSNHRFNISIS